MTITRDITKQQQTIARCEKSLALEKLKKRRADTRHKIEVGGLVVKSGMDGFNKSVILGGLDYIQNLITKDANYITLFNSRGDQIFLVSSQK